MADSRYRKAAELLEAVIGADALRAAAKYGNAISGWRKIAGERLAAHSRVVDIRNGVVLVEADHPGWIQLLQVEQIRMRNEFRSAYPELGIVSITFRLASTKGERGTRELSKAERREDGIEREGLGESGSTEPGDASFRNDEEGGGNGGDIRRRGAGDDSGPAADSGESVRAIESNPELSALFERFKREVEEESGKSGR